MSSGSDALSQEIRDAIRAKHRLVEKMKESVVEASDRPRDQKKKGGISFGAFAWWKVALVCAFVALVVVSVQQAATSDRAAEIRANMRARTQRKAWERAEVKRWSSERMLRHFGLRRASSLRFTEPVYTFADLWDAVRDPDTHVITVEVAVDAATMEPAVRTSTYAKPERFAMTLDKLLTSFARTGSNKGLRFVFRDPRAIEPTTRAIGARVDDGKIVSPVILEAEVAAGPEGYLPEMSAILSDAHSWQAKDATEARPPRSYTLAQIANTRPDATFVPYDPTTLIDAAKRDVPGAILSLSAATHVSCALEQPVRRDSRIEKRLIKDQLLRGITRVKRFGQKARANGARHGMGPDIPPMIRKAIARVGGAGIKAANASAVASSIANAQRKAASAARDAAAAATGGGGGASSAAPSADEGDAKPSGDDRRRTLLQLDADMSAFAAEEAAKQAAMKETDLDDVKDGAHIYGDAPKSVSQESTRHDIRAQAAKLTNARGYGWRTHRSILDLINDAGWAGDVYFPMHACVMPRTDPGFVRALLDVSFGNAAMIRGPALLTKRLRLWILEELSVSRTFLADDFVRLPEGERVSEKTVFLDPVTENPEATLEGLMDGGAGDGTASAGTAKVVRGWKETLQNLKSFTSNYVHRNDVQQDEA